MSRLDRHPRLLLLACGLLAAMFLSATAVIGTNFNEGGGPIKKVRVATADDLVFTLPDDNYHDVPGMVVNMTIPSGEKGLFLMTSSGDHLCGQASCSARVVINGAVAAPGELVLDGTGASQRSFSMQWLASPMPAGA